MGDAASFEQTFGTKASGSIPSWARIVELPVEEQKEEPSSEDVALHSTPSPPPKPLSPPKSVLKPQSRQRRRISKPPPVRRRRKIVKQFPVRVGRKRSRRGAVVPRMPTPPPPKAPTPPPPPSPPKSLELEPEPVDPWSRPEELAPVLDVAALIEPKPKKSFQLPSRTAEIQDVLTNVCDNVVSAVANFDSAVAGLLRWKDALVQQHLPVCVLIHLTASASRVFRSKSELYGPLLQLIHSVQRLSSPWQSREEEITHLSQEVERKVKERDAAIRKLNTTQSQLGQILAGRAMLRWKRWTYGLQERQRWHRKLVYYRERAEELTRMIAALKTGSSPRPPSPFSPLPPGRHNALSVSSQSSGTWSSGDRIVVLAPENVVTGGKGSLVDVSKQREAYERAERQRELLERAQREEEEEGERQRVWEERLRTEWAMSDAQVAKYSPHPEQEEESEEVPLGTEADEALNTILDPGLQMHRSIHRETEQMLKLNVLVEAVRKAADDGSAMMEQVQHKGTTDDDVSKQLSQMIQDAQSFAQDAMASIDKEPTEAMLAAEDALLSYQETQSPRPLYLSITDSKLRQSGYAEVEEEKAMDEVVVSESSTPESRLSTPKVSFAVEVDSRSPRRYIFSAPTGHVGGLEREECVLKKQDVPSKMDASTSTHDLNPVVDQRRSSTVATLGEHLLPSVPPPPQPSWRGSAKKKSHPRSSKAKVQKKKMVREQGIAMDLWNPLVDMPIVPSELPIVDSEPPIGRDTQTTPGLLLHGGYGAFPKGRALMHDAAEQWLRDAKSLSRAVLSSYPLHPPKLEDLGVHEKEGRPMSASVFPWQDVLRMSLLHEMQVRYLIAEYEKVVSRHALAAARAVAQLHQREEGPTLAQWNERRAHRLHQHTMDHQEWLLKEREQRASIIEQQLAARRMLARTVEEAQEEEDEILPAARKDAIFDARARQYWQPVGSVSARVSQPPTFFHLPAIQQQVRVVDIQPRNEGPPEIKRARKEPHPPPPTALVRAAPRSRKPKVKKKVEEVGEWPYGPLFRVKQ